MLEAKILIEDIEYKFYINDKLYKVQIFSEDKVGYLNTDEIKELINSLFEDDKKLYKKENGYEIYLDSNNNKRFIKDGVEDLKLFFLSNGTSAIAYKKDENKKSNQTKRFILGKKGNILLNCTMSFMLFLSSFNLFMLCTDEQFLNNETYLAYEALEYTKGHNLTADEVTDKILNSKGENLTEHDKRFLANRNFLNFVLENTSYSRQNSLRSHITDIGIEYFDEQYKNDNPNLLGYYNSLHENILFVRSAEEHNREDILAHEYAHLLQHNNKYSYIREACAELFGFEFFGSSIISYTEQIKRTCILMEIIGPEPVIECNFKGIENFENTIKDILGEKDGNKLLNLFLEVPSEEDKTKVNSEIDEYLTKMYNIVYSDDIDNNMVIQDLKNFKDIESILYNRKYFNKNNYAYYLNYVPLYDKIDKIEEIPLYELNFNEIENIYVSIHSADLPIKFVLPNNQDILHKRFTFNPNEMVLSPEERLDYMVHEFSEQNALIVVVFKDGSFAQHSNGIFFKELPKRSYPSIYHLFDKKAKNKNNKFQ